MSGLFTTYLYQPILSALVFIYTTVAFHDLGIAIIVLTVAVRTILFPLFYKGAKDQSILQRLQPHVKQIQLDHKDNKEEQARALMTLYKKHRVNPFSSLGLLAVQLPVFIALFQLFTKELSGAAFDSTLSLGVIHLDEKSIVITIIAALLQYIQGKISLPPQKKETGDNTKNTLAATGKLMVYLGPFMTLIILSNLPAALGVYWVTTTVFSILQQVYINKKLAEEPTTKNI